jgi:hypothetical protein
LLNINKPVMMETLLPETRSLDLVLPGKPVFSAPDAPLSTDKKLQIRESISWSICFALVAGLTGALLVYKIGVTMSAVTSVLFYFSLLGLAAFVARIIVLLRSRVMIPHAKAQQLN